MALEVCNYTGSGGSGGSGPNSYVQTMSGVSLTDYIELILINTIHNVNRTNKFNMIKFQRTELRNAASKVFGAIMSDYTPYILINFNNNRANIKQISYVNQIKRKATYFFVKNGLTINRYRLYNSYQTKQGIMSIPVQMPSRLLYWSSA